MPFEFPKLPYAEDALEPHISRQTLSFHHGKHHKTYVDNLNRLTEGSDLASKPIEEVIRAAAKENKTPIFNNAAQAWNHDFFWKCMAPKGGGAPKGEIAKRIEDSFGGFDKFKDQFVQKAVGQFGSGWAWLIQDGGKLDIVTTHDAGTPLVDGKTPLITCDVWEHAYYLDYQNRRADFVKAFVENLANWSFAESRLGAPAGAR